jgi:hypothetical protein
MPHCEHLFSDGSIMFITSESSAGQALLNSILAHLFNLVNSF